MIEITGIRGIGQTEVQRARTRTGGAVFNPMSDPPEAELAGAEAAGDTIQAAGVSGLAGLLAMQEAGAGTVGDRAARRHGQALLAELAGLQRALLASGSGRGDLDPSVLRRLCTLADDVPDAADPALAAILGGIIVRARVELARHGI